MLIASVGMLLSGLYAFIVEHVTPDAGMAIAGIGGLAISSLFLKAAWTGRDPYIVEESEPRNGRISGRDAG
jgi:hypothetical protein